MNTLCSGEKLWKVLKKSSLAITLKALMTTTLITSFIYVLLVLLYPKSDYLPQHDNFMYSFLFICCTFFILVTTTLVIDFMNFPKLLSDYPRIFKLYRKYHNLSIILTKLFLLILLSIGLTANTIDSNKNEYYNDTTAFIILLLTLIVISSLVYPPLVNLQHFIKRNKPDFLNEK